jgi:hypothetical protein
MTNNRTSYYNERLRGLEKEEGKLKVKIRWLSWTRLAVFLAIFPGIFILGPSSIVTGILCSLFFLILFLSLIKRFNRLEGKHNHMKALIELNRKEIQAASFDYSAFNPGSEYINTAHPYSYDMDLFGEGSLFQYLNRTATFGGSKGLAVSLTNETLDEELIIKKQEAIRELGAMNELLQDFMAAGTLQKENENDSSDLLHWIERPVYYLHHPVYRLLLYILPAATAVSILLAFFSSPFRSLSLIFFFTQLAITGSRLKHTNAEHNLISKLLRVLIKYSQLLAVVEKGKYTGEIVSGLYKTLIVGETSASASIKSLSKQVSAFDNRLNLLAAIFLEGILLWDIRCMIRLEKWRTEQGAAFHKWMEAIATFDAYASLGTFAFNHPSFVFPKFSSKSILEAKALGHVLIPEHERVTNVFFIRNKGEFIIITGANMAGKSTFLRTVVTNMVLAMAGAPVCAESFSLRPVQIFSSMRTSDSLNKHESYFYAELKRLKDLLDRMRNGDSLFIVLDEILKGTNSTDKQRGSRSVMEQILKLGGTGIIATHDLELASIENEFPERVKNLCFEIEIDEANISFDYKLKEGITTKMNALLLMQQMGIITDRSVN